MSRFDHRVFVYISLETTSQNRFALSHHIDLPPLKEIAKRVKITCQLIEIGLKSLAWGLARSPGGKPWRKMSAENLGGAL